MDVFTLMGKITIDIQEALNNISSVIEKVQELESMLNGTQTAAQTTAEDTGDAVAKSADGVASKTSNTLSKWNVFLGNIATQAANKVYGMGKSFMQTGYEFNANMDLWRSQLQNMLNLDFDEADEFLDRLHQFAVDTPYSMDEVMSNAIELLGNKKIRENTDVVELLTMIGNMSNGDNAAFSSIAKGILQVFTKGKVQAEEANQQFAERGVDVWQMLADYFSYIDRGGQDEWTADDVSSLSLVDPTTMATAQEFYEAMKYANFSDGGFYAGRMDAMMNTAAGQAQRMKDAYEQAAGSFTKAIFDVFSSDTMPAISNILDKLDKWATENPDALKKLGEAFSELATGGVDLLVLSLTGLLEFWEQNQDMFNGMLLLFGGLAIKTGHIGAGMALITAGGYPVWSDWLKEQQAQMSALTSDVDLGFIKQQLDYQGKSDQWEAYLANWKAAQLKAGYDEETIENYVATQLANYKPYTDDAMQAVFEGYQGSGAYNNGGMGALDAVTTLIDAANGGEKEESSLPAELQYLNFRRQRDYVPDTSEGGTSGSNSLYSQIVALIQQNATMKQDIMAATQEGVANGLSGVTITGTISTGDVKLQDGTLVGRLAPQLDLRLGWQDKFASRGNA